MSTPDDVSCINPFEIQATPMLCDQGGRCYRSVKDRKYGKLVADTLNVQLLTAKIRQSFFCLLRILWIKFCFQQRSYFFGQCRAKEASNRRLEKKS